MHDSAFHPDVLTIPLVSQYVSIASVLTTDPPDWRSAFSTPSIGFTYRQPISVHYYPSRERVGKSEELENLENWGNRKNWWNWEKDVLRWRRCPKGGGGIISNNSTHEQFHPRPQGGHHLDSTNQQINNFQIFKSLSDEPDGLSA